MSFNPNARCKKMKQELDYIDNARRQFTCTPFIVTFYEGTLTNIDIQNFLEADLRIVRFKIGHTKKDKLELIDMLKSGVDRCCKKYGVATWPVAITIDLPNALILTGYINEDLRKTRLHFQKGDFVELTNDPKYKNKCDLKRIYVDDQYICKMIKPKQEICIPLSSMNLICTEVIDDHTVKCKILSSGVLVDYQVICFRGLKLERPPLTEPDMKLLHFVKQHELDVVVINSIRRAATAHMVSKFFRDSHKPLIFGSIAEQEGLDNIDDIIEACDGIVLAREFLFESILNFNQMTAIQLNIIAKCKRVGKPIYVSGNIFEETVSAGYMVYSEVNDATNIVLEGAGLIIRNIDDPTNVLKCLRLFNSISRTVEPMSLQAHYWRLTMELEPPVNAAEATIMAAAMASRQRGAGAIIVLTVTGRTATQLSRFYPKSFIVAVCTDLKIGKRLQLYRGIVPVIYERKEKGDWHVDMQQRIDFALRHCIRHELLKYKEPYAVLRKSKPDSAFCNQLSFYDVKEELPSYLTKSSIY